MLSEITPEEFDEWVAMNQILPFGDEKICRVLALGFAALVDRLNLLATAWGAKDLPETKPADFIPWKKPKKKKQKYVNPNAVAAAFKMAVNR